MISGNLSDGFNTVQRQRKGHIPVVPANRNDLSVTTEHESAAMESGATDVPKSHPCREDTGGTSMESRSLAGQVTVGHTAIIGRHG